MQFFLIVPQLFWGVSIEQILENGKYMQNRTNKTKNKMSLRKNEATYWVYDSWEMAELKDSWETAVNKKVNVFTPVSL